MKTYVVSFFGHRLVENFWQVEAKLEEVIQGLMAEHAYVEFLVGRNGDFDQIVSSTVKRLQRTFRSDNSSLVLVVHPYAVSSLDANLDSFRDYYDEILIYEPEQRIHPKAIIQERNRYMVDRSNLVIFYVEHEQGGAFQTLKYTRKSGVPHKNLAQEK